MNRNGLTLLLILLFSGSLHAAPTLHNLVGEKIPFSDLKGKWVFIHYWASWCETCLEELPELNRFYEKNKASNIALFAVNYDSPPVKQQQQLNKTLNIQFPSLAQNPAKELNLGWIQGVPVTFVFNPNGELADTLYGPQTIMSLTHVMRGRG